MSLKKVIDYTLVQSNEVGGSYYMEKEGLERILKYLNQSNLSIEVLVTDRHVQINKWLRDHHPSIKHYYDIWNVAKGLRKKLEAAAKQKGCKLIGDWQKSIINHLYWCISSTPDGNVETVAAKWESLDNHVHNEHTHENTKFITCAHGKLKGSSRKKKWFKRHSQASEKISSLLSNTRLRKYICRLSPGHQTSSLESYHSLVIDYAPKFVPLSYQGMNCRLALAALHFNENAGRQQAVNSKGEGRYLTFFFQNIRKEVTLYEKLVNPTYNYVDELKTETVQWCKEGIIELSTNTVPPTLSTQFERPDKLTAVKCHESRFSL